MKAYVYESPDKGTTVYRRPSRALNRRGNGVELGHAKEGVREKLQKDGTWVEVSDGHSQN